MAICHTFVAVYLNICLPKRNITISGSSLSIKLLQISGNDKQDECLRNTDAPGAPVSNGATVNCIYLLSQF